MRAAGIDRPAPGTRHLAHDARGGALAQPLYDTEHRGIADDTLTAVGLGIVAVRA